MVSFLYSFILIYILISYLTEFPLRFVFRKWSLWCVLCFWIVRNTKDRLCTNTWKGWKKKKMTNELIDKSLIGRRRSWRRSWRSWTCLSINLLSSLLFITCKCICFTFFVSTKLILLLPFNELWIFDDTLINIYYLKSICLTTIINTKIILLLSCNY